MQFSSAGYYEILPSQVLQLQVPPDSVVVALLELEPDIATDDPLDIVSVFLISSRVLGRRRDFAAKEINGILVFHVYFFGAQSLKMAGQGTFAVLYSCLCDRWFSLLLLFFPHSLHANFSGNDLFQGVRQ